MACLLICAYCHPGLSLLSAQECRCCSGPKPESRPEIARESREAASSFAWWTCRAPLEIKCMTSEYHSKWHVTIVLSYRQMMYIAMGDHRRYIVWLPTNHWINPLVTVLSTWDQWKLFAFCCFSNFFAFKMALADFGWTGVFIKYHNEWWCVSSLTQWHLLVWQDWLVPAQPRWPVPAQSTGNVHVFAPKPTAVTMLARLLRICHTPWRCHVKRWSKVEKEAWLNPSHFGGCLFLTSLGIGQLKSVEIVPFLHCSSLQFSSLTWIKAAYCFSFLHELQSVNFILVNVATWSFPTC